ncbi:MAG: hypothetical protein LBS69_03885 [Prevotellaceae bacterium]|nr:hypothetical protein [Prevotellaceae bacterium]
MYDNLTLKLRNTEATDIDFLNETAKYFDITGKHNFNNETVLSGILHNDFKITANRNGVNISGSLCKYYLGDNFQTLGRSDTQRAIEKLSDRLHLPLVKATVSRLDVAQNLIVNKPVNVYYNHLGELKHSGRAAVTNGAGTIETLYYYQSKGLLIFYDKIKEQKDKRQPIPELYKNSNVLRYEQRYQRRLPKAFNVERVTAAMLYNEKFYINLLDMWKNSYFAIKKINDITLNFENMKGKKDLYTLGLLSLIETAGGELAIITQIKEAYKSGKLTKKADYDMRQAIKAACREKVGITAKNECIFELDKKVNEAVKFYR